MRRAVICVMAVLAAAFLPTLSITARADLLPGGWLQPPRLPPVPPAAEAPPAAETPPQPEPAAAQPVLVAPPPPAAPAAVEPLPAPKVTRPAVHHRPPAPPRPPSDGKVQF